MGSSPDGELTGDALLKEVCRLIRAARASWNAHQSNDACARQRAQALRLYETLTPEQKERVPQALRVWLRYRSERYFGAQRGRGATARPGRARRGARRSGTPETGEPGSSAS